MAGNLWTETVMAENLVANPRTKGAPKAEGRVVPSRRIEYLQERLKTNSKRDLHLWSISMLVILMLASGFAAVLAPSVAWNIATLHFDLKYLPQLFWGMIALVLLFSLYAMTQKRDLNIVSRALVQELILSENLQSFSVLDPVTQLLNSWAIDPIIAKEIAHANRLGSALTFATIRLDNFQSIKKQLGPERGEEALYHAARLLKGTFRGSDVIFRNGADEFLVVLPDTTEQQAESAVARLGTATERWNADSDTGFEFSFCSGIAPHVIGAESRDVIERARRGMIPSSQKIKFVF